MSRQLPEIYTIPYDQYIRDHGITLMEYFARLKQADKGAE